MRNIEKTEQIYLPNTTILNVSMQLETIIEATNLSLQMIEILLFFH